jgi:hypothetical protein
MFAQGEKQENVRICRNIAMETKGAMNEGTF